MDSKLNKTLFVTSCFSSDPIIGPHALLEDAVHLAKKGAQAAGKVKFK